MTAEFEAELLLELEERPGGIQVTRLIGELFWEVLDNGSDELEEQLATLAGRVSSPCWNAVGLQFMHRMFIAGQLQGMAGVLMAKRLRATATKT